MSVLASFEPEIVAGTEVMMIQLWTPAERGRGHFKFFFEIKVMHGDL